MILIWFLYGLAFFLLGFGILVYPKKGSTFTLAKHIWLIGAFGLIHGTNEWLDMFITLGGPLPLNVLKPLSLLTLVTSFVFLVIFGVKFIGAKKIVYRMLQLLPFILLLVWTGITIFSHDRFLLGDIMARYLICVPGTFLTAFALRLQIQELKHTHLKTVINCLQLSVVLFILYGIAAGIVVKKADFFPANVLNYDVIFNTTGLPIQAYRIIFAVMLTGAFLYALSIFHWETQQQIRQSEERFSAIASEMPLFLFAIDHQCQITFAQGNGLKLLDMRSNKIIGKNVLDAFDFLPQIDQDCRRSLEGEEFGASFRIEDYFFEAHYMPLRAEDGNIVGSMCLALDVTARAKAQEQLENYRRQIETNTRLAEIGTLSSVMVGKMKDPLTIACLRMQRLLIDVESDETLRGTFATKGLKKCLSDISAAADIVYGFQQTAQVQLHDHAEPVDFYKISKTMVEVFSESARRVNLSIILKDIDCFATIAVSTRELEQIFFILIQHSIDSADPNKQQQLTISCRTSKDHIELLFSDNCSGYDTEHIDRIFTPFLPQQQGSSDSGIGLAAAKRLVCAHGGDIHAESVSGKGISFLVMIPAERIH